MARRRYNYLLSHQLGDIRYPPAPTPTQQNAPVMKLRSRHQSWSPTGPDSPPLELADGARIAVIGGGPAGSFFTYFLLDMAERIGLTTHVDIYETRDFSGTGPAACNMCGGIISETLVQNLATEGINLPHNVVQRAIDSYVLHMAEGSVRIETPVHEMSVAAVYRAAGPRGAESLEWDGFDAFLLSLATEKGASLIKERVQEVTYDGKIPRIKTKEGTTAEYDLLVVAAGVNAPTLKLFEEVDLPFRPPETTKTFIREYLFDADTMAKYLGTSINVFLLNIPNLEFAAIIPKGRYASACLLGENIQKTTLQEFMDSREVKSCMPPQWESNSNACQCSPRMNVRAAVEPFCDRIVFIGDSGVTRLYKDGIGGAYRTAKAAASSAVFHGVSQASFRKSYWPICRAIEKDNDIGRLVFAVCTQIQKRGFARRAVLSMVAAEQRRAGHSRRMSMVLWDLFTGSAPYRDILMRTLHPGFWARLVWYLILAVVRAKAVVPSASDDETTHIERIAP